MLSFCSLVGTSPSEEVPFGYPSSNILHQGSVLRPPIHMDTPSVYAILVLSSMLSAYTVLLVLTRHRVLPLEDHLDLRSH